MTKSSPISLMAEPSAFRWLGLGVCPTPRRSSALIFVLLAAVREFIGLKLMRTSALKECFTVFPHIDHARPHAQSIECLEIMPGPAGAQDQRIARPNADGRPT